MTKKKSVILILSAMLILLIILLTYYYLIPILRFCGMFPMPPSYSKCEKIYSKYESDLNNVADWLYNSEYEDTRIDIFESASKIEYTLSGKNEWTSEEISDKAIIESLKTLDKKGFITILKEYNYICFSLYSSLNQGVEILFSPLGEPDISDIYVRSQELKPLKFKSWYYHKVIQK